MRVEPQKNILEALHQNTEVDGRGSNAVFLEKSTVTKAKHSDNQSVFIKDSTYLKPTREEKKTLAEEIEQGTALDAFDRKNQMAVLSHTTTEEDYAKMQEEGFSLETTASHTIITVTDKIKMQIAKAGGDISCFGDELTAEQLEELTGSAALATQLEQAFHEADLPLSEENITNVLEALEQALSLSPMKDGAVKYMLDNALPPTIENIYKAEYSGSMNYSGNQEEKIDISGFLDQIEKVIYAAGFSVNEQMIADSKWLLEHDLPLTKENLNYFEDLKNAEFPAEESYAVSSIAKAIAEGKEPQTAMLIAGYSLKDQAEHAVDIIKQATEEDLSYLSERGMELTISNLKEAEANRGQTGEQYGNGQPKAGEGDSEAGYTNIGLKLITAKRQLEETRLFMTAEANYALLKRGISIDTEPLVKLVEELKNIENQYYASLLEAQGGEASEEKLALFAETSGKLYEMQSVPAYVLGLSEADLSDINGVHEAGTALKASMDQAKESYETLMTAPRSDLGDSIEKAFRNVDDILKDLSMENSEENRRAVRILAYNSLEITKESVLQMKAADEEVQRVFRNLSPAVVTEMIKEGINPLEMDFASLNQTAENIRNMVGKKDTERFSEYLWKLEKNHEITAEERSSFIGIYRLIHQVEQTDGAAIGALVHQGADLSLKNLMVVVRSGNKSGKINAFIDESFGEQDAEAKVGNSITDQIMTAYQTNCMRDAGDLLSPERLFAVIKEHPDWENMTPEAFKEALKQAEEEGMSLDREYIREQLDSLRQCAKASDEIYQMLQQYDIPNTMQNVLAMESMMSHRNQLYQQIFGKNEKSPRQELKEELEQIKQDLLEDFGEAVAEPKELAEAQETLAKVAENVMKTMIDSDEVTSIDVREARLMQAKLSIQGQMAKKESYSIPVLVGDEVTNVSLKIVRGVKTKGIVDIMLEDRMTGKIAATFQAKENGISGLIATDSQNTRAALEEHLESFASSLQGDGKESVDLNAAYIKELDLNHFSGVSVSEAKSDSATEKTDEKEEYHVQTTRLYHIAESFLQLVKDVSHS